MLKALAVLLLVSSSWANELPDAPSPQPPPQPLFTYQYQTIPEPPVSVPKLFGTDPFLWLKRSPHKLPRVTGKVLDFSLRHYDPSSPPINGMPRKLPSRYTRKPRH